MKEFTCHSCKTKGTWNEGSPNGNLYFCENDCGNVICFSCIAQVKEYRENMLSLNDGIPSIEKIECGNCRKEND